MQDKLTENLGFIPKSLLIVHALSCLYLASCKRGFIFVPHPTGKGWSRLKRKLELLRWNVNSMTNGITWKSQYNKKIPKPKMVSSLTSQLLS